MLRILDILRVADVESRGRSQQSENNLKLKLTDRQKGILLVALVATLGIVVAINWASKRVTDLYGPTVLAQASDGRVWLVLNHELHVLDRHGTQVRRFPVRALGISPPVAWELE